MIRSTPTFFHVCCLFLGLSFLSGSAFANTATTQAVPPVTKHQQVVNYIVKVMVPAYQIYQQQGMVGLEQHSKQCYQTMGYKMDCYYIDVFAHTLDQGRVQQLKTQPTPYFVGEPLHQRFSKVYKQRPIPEADQHDFYMSVQNIAVLLIQHIKQQGHSLK